MPDIGVFHPQIVHFVVALSFAGVIGRWLFLTGKAPWAGPAATTLLLACTIAAVAAVQSGDDAHGPVERVPGVRPAVEEHEKAGKWARNVLLAVAALEIAALALGQRPQRKWVLVASGVVGLAGLAAVYEAAEHGGDLVYEYAGGVGIRSGDPADVTHLLTAGLYHQIAADRAAGKKEDAARLVDELVRRRPDDPAMRFTAIESQIQDRGDAQGALTALHALPLAPDDRRGALQRDLLLSDAYVAAGFSDSARAVLRVLADSFPQSRAVQERLGRLGS